MPTQVLTEARRLADRVRFSLDAFSGGPVDDAFLLRQTRGFYAQTDVEISEALTPGLDQCLRSAYENLKVPPVAVQAFVYASADIQAECLTAQQTECVVRFTSALVDLLDDREIKFVAGHELGHFLLSHQAPVGPVSIQHYMQNRYQEVSADRMGLIACGSMDTAVRTLMKISSGLSDRHMRFDVPAFLNQIRHVRSSDHRGRLQATHPPVLLRARALLWFSMSEFFTNGPDSGPQDEMEKLDDKVAADFKQYVDGTAHQVVDHARQSVTIWTVADRVMGEGVVFRKSQQRATQELLGEEAAESLRCFFSNGQPHDQLAQTVKSRLTDATRELESLVSKDFEVELSRIQRKVVSCLGRHS